MADDEREFIEFEVTLMVRVPADDSIWGEYSRFGSADRGHTEAVAEVFRRVLPSKWDEWVQVRSAQTPTARDTFGSIHPF